MRVGLPCKTGPILEQILVDALNKESSDGDD